MPCWTISNWINCTSVHEKKTCKNDQRNAFKKEVRIIENILVRKSRRKDWRRWRRNRRAVSFSSRVRVDRQARSPALSGTLAAQLVREAQPTVSKYLQNRSQPKSDPSPFSLCEMLQWKSKMRKFLDLKIHQITYGPETQDAIGSMSHLGGSGEASFVGLVHSYLPPIGSDTRRFLVPTTKKRLLFPIRFEVRLK